jgi:hypothetical protein
LRITPVDQHIARQPEQLAEQRHPLQALLADTHSTTGHDVAEHEQIVVGLMVGDDHAAVRLVHQAADVRFHPQAQNAHGWQCVEAGAQTAVVRVERAADPEDHPEYACQNKVQAHQ